MKCCLPMSPVINLVPRFIRWEQSLFGAIAIFISGILSGDLIGIQIEYSLAFAIVFLSAAGSFAFNDYCDRRIDRKNARLDRPLVSDGVKETTPLAIGLLCLVIAGALSVLLNNHSALLVLLSLPLFYLYSLGLKRVIVVKNLVIAYSFAAVILLGSLVTDGVLEPLIIYFALMAFILGFAIEIMLDIADVVGDLDQGVLTIPGKIGNPGAATIAVILYATIVFMDPLPFFVQIDQRLLGDPAFLVLIMIPVVSYVLVSRSLARDQSGENVLRLKNRVMNIMQVGCGAYLVGVLL